MKSVTNMFIENRKRFQFINSRKQRNLDHYFLEFTRCEDVLSFEKGWQKVSLHNPFKLRQAMKLFQKRK